MTTNRFSKPESRPDRRGALAATGADPDDGADDVAGHCIRPAALAKPPQDDSDTETSADNIPR